jgi:hypothetical protein
MYIIYMMNDLEENEVAKQFLRAETNILFL